MMQIWQKAEKIYSFLEDDLSKRIFEKKIDWMLMGGGEVDETIDLMYETYSESRILALEKTYGKNIKVAIAGAGALAEESYRALTHAGYQVMFFLDNDTKKQGQSKFGVPIISFSEFVILDEDIVVILDNNRLASVFYRELLELGCSRKKIFINPEDVVRTAFGNIYFDLPEMAPLEDEVFLDAGSFDGETIIEFIKWCEGRYEKIYAFEPMEEGLALTKHKLKEIKNVEILNCALSNRDGEAQFSQSYSGLMGSGLGKRGDKTTTVALRSIDSILDGGKATFIKMDIEGSELAALQGAKKTIMKYRPRLAISLYHKKEDIIEIPIWLKTVAPEYKFFLRHYSNKVWDFILYAI